MNADDELDRVLLELFESADARTRAPEGFDARLFARLEREAPRVASFRPAMPWWVRAAAERHVVLAFALAGALLAWPMWWATEAARAAAFFAGLAGAVMPVLFAPLAAPHVALATAVCLAPAVAWASYQAALSAERWTYRAALGHA